jgi:DNA (cytosine-5)-methyltransferase 1
MRVVSLFCGAGGLDLGFIKAGHKVVWASDYDEHAVSTYRRNISSHVHLADIRQVNTEEIPVCDLVIGGFPCQGFSVANTGRTADDKRNKLYLELLRVIKDKSPTFFLAENVKGLLSLGKGNVFRVILNDFKELGYDVSYSVLNAADFGVPQKRQRLFIVGVKSGTNFKFRFPTPTHAPRDRCTLLGLKPWIGVGDALSLIPDPDETSGIPNHTYSKYKLRFNGYLGHRRIDPLEPAPTVTARGDNRGGVVVLHHPSNLRRMSARELATVQSFPLDFEFVGNQSVAYRLIGNAVPPGLAYFVAKRFPKRVP